MVASGDPLFASTIARDLGPSGLQGAHGSMCTCRGKPGARDVNGSGTSTKNSSAGGSDEKQHPMVRTLLHRPGLGRSRGAECTARRRRSTSHVRCRRSGCTKAKVPNSRQLKLPPSSSANLRIWIGHSPRRPISSLAGRAFARLGGCRRLLAHRFARSRVLARLCSRPTRGVE